MVVPSLWYYRRYRGEEVRSVKRGLTSMRGCAKILNLVSDMTVELTTDLLLTKSIDRLLLPI